MQSGGCMWYNDWNIKKGKKKKVSEKHFFFFSIYMMRYSIAYEISNVMCYTRACALLRMFWIVQQVVLREEERTQGQSQSEKWLNQAKQVQWRNWFVVIPPCILQLGTKHNVPLSWKFGTIAFTSQNTNKTHVHKPAIVDAAIRPRSHRFIAFHVNKLTFVGLSIEFNLLWFCSRQNTQAVLCVSAIVSKELSGQNCFLTGDKTDRIDAILLN